jgi:hypothetical protein
MVKSWARPFLSVILLAAFSSTGSAQDAKAAISAAAKAMGTENLRTLQYSGSGSIYDEKGQHLTMRSLQPPHISSLAIEFEWSEWKDRAGSAQSEFRRSNSVQPGMQQFDFWLTPYEFFERPATANKRTVEL